MIEVIRPGTKDRVECKHCGALLSYQKDDIKKSYYGNPFCQLNWEKYIICCQCNGKVILEATK